MPLMLLFLVALGAILWNWSGEPPLQSGTLVASSRGQNMSGDLGPVLVGHLFQFLVALAALQPLRPEPRVRWMALAGFLFGSWSVLGFMTGLHAPPVARIQNAFTFFVAILLILTALAILFRAPAPPHLDQPT